MWESISNHTVGIMRDLSDKFSSGERHPNSQSQFVKKDAMKNVVTPNSIPQFTVPPLMPYDILITTPSKDGDCETVSNPPSRRTSTVQHHRSSVTQMEESLKCASLNTPEGSPSSQSKRNKQKAKRIEQQSQPGLSLSHLLSTKSGFSTLTESPNTRRKESLFLTPHREVSPLVDQSYRSHDYASHDSSSDSDVSKNFSPTSSPLIDKLRTKRLFGRSTAESDSNNSSAHSTPYVSPSVSRKASKKQSLDKGFHSDSIDYHVITSPGRTKQFENDGKSPTSPCTIKPNKLELQRESVKRSLSDVSGMSSSVNLSDGETSSGAKTPRIHLVLTYLPKQQKINISIIEVENFTVGKVIYLKVSLLPHFHGYHKTDPFKVSGTLMDIKERFTFEFVKEEDIQHMSLEISCKEKLSRLRQTSVLGKSIITLCDINKQLKNDMWLDLKTSSIKEATHLQLSLCYHAVLGFVTVEVISARNIPKGSLGRYQDCYIVLTEEPHYDKSMKKQTKISQRNKDPCFQEPFMFAMTHDKLVIVATLYVKDRGHWTPKGEVKLGQEVEHWSGQNQWVQALAKEGQPVTSWHLLTPC